MAQPAPTSTLSFLGFHSEWISLDSMDGPRRLEIHAKGKGPPLILLHELPGLSLKTFELGEDLASHGYRVVMPVLFGRAGEENALNGLLQICLRRELQQLWRGEEGAITSMIRQLCHHELQTYRQSEPQATGVAVVGMCLTGSMVLALLHDDSNGPTPVSAPVLAQPSAEFSSEALKSAARGEIKGPVLALRFEKDWICSSQHFAVLEAAFQDCPAQPGCPAQASRLIVHELKGKGHSTLVYDYRWWKRHQDLRDPEADLLDAREVLRRFLSERLKAPRPDADQP